MPENTRKTYFPESQKRYGKKCKIFTVKYFPEETTTADKIEKAIEKSGMSANAFIKLAIEEKIERLHE